MSHVTDCDLAVLSGVANVLRVGANYVWKLNLKGVNDVARLVEAKGGLGEICDAVRVGNLKRLDLGDVGDNLCNFRRFAQGALDFIVVAVADEDQRIALTGEFDGLDVDLVTRGQVASITFRPRPLLISRTAGETPWAE